MYAPHSFYQISLQTLSAWATSSVEEVASTGPGIRFFQLYVSLTDEVSHFILYYVYLFIFIFIFLLLAICLVLLNAFVICDFIGVKCKHNSSCLGTT